MTGEMIEIRLAKLRRRLAATTRAAVQSRSEMRYDDADTFREDIPHIRAEIAELEKRQECDNA